MAPIHDDHAVDRKPDRLRPAPATLALVAGAATVVLMHASTHLPLWGLGLVTALAGLYVVNVALGGGATETPLHAFGRIRRFSKNPGTFGRDVPANNDRR